MSSGRSCFLLLTVGVSEAHVTSNANSMTTQLRFNKDKIIPCDKQQVQVSTSNQLRATTSDYKQLGVTTSN